MTNPQLRPLSSFTPTQIDTEIARLSSDLDASGLHLSLLQRRIGDLEKGKRSAYYGVSIESLREAYAEGLRIESGLRRELDPYLAEYARRPWARYFLVTNSNGHVHSSTSCSTCFYSTRYSWLVDLADKPVVDLVEEWGEQCCTVCFPEAPSHPRFAQPSKQTLLAQATKDAEKAAREAKKAEKNLTPDQVFRGRWGKVTTVAGAKTCIRDAIELADYFGHRHPDADQAEADARRATEVLLERGVTQAEIDKIIANKTKAWAKETGS